MTLNEKTPFACVWRGYGAIEQIYRWAATSDAEVRRKRSDDEFVAQIKRVAKQLGWRA